MNIRDYASSRFVAKKIEIANPDIVSKVEKWLKEESYFVKWYDESPDYYASFECKFPWGQGHPFFVFLLAKRDMVWIETEFIFGLKTQSVLSEIAHNGDNFLRDLEYTSTYIGCELYLLDEDNKEYPASAHLQKMRIREAVFYDGLSKQSLISAILRMTRMSQAIGIILGNYHIRTNGVGPISHNPLSG